MQEEKLTFEEQIQSIYGRYTNSRLSRDVVERIKQLINMNLQQIVQETVKRSILRDCFNNQLDQRDLLSVVQKLGPKYKTVIGFHLLKVSNMSLGKMDMGAGIDEEEDND